MVRVLLVPTPACLVVTLAARRVQVPLAVVRLPLPTLVRLSRPTALCRAPLANPPRHRLLVLLQVSLPPPPLFVLRATGPQLSPAMAPLRARRLRARPLRSLLLRSRLSLPWRLSRCLESIST